MFSEIADMCVRDHIRSPEAELMVPALTMYLLGAQTPFRLGAECTLDAVSYTHLTLPTIYSV